MHRRLTFASLAVAFALSACRGGGGPSFTPGAGGPNDAARASVAAAGTIHFVAIGPTHMTSNGLANSGKVNAFAQDPNDPLTIYVASGRGTGLETYSSAGIFRSTDGGASWTATDSGLTDTSGIISSAVNALWLDPANPSVVLAATEYDGIFRSTNAGASWSNVYATTQATQFASFGGSLYAATKTGIVASSDDGATWSVSLPGTPSRYPRALAAVSGSAGNAFYAGMSNGSIDAFSNGAWKRVGVLPYDAHTGTDGSSAAVHQIAVDPLVPTTLYASSNDGRWDQDLHASVDGGHTWNDVSPQEFYHYGLGSQAIAFSVVHPHLLYVGVDGGLLTIDGNGATNARASAGANLSVIDLRDIWTAPNGTDDRCWIASDQGLDDVPSCSTYGRFIQDRVVTSTLATGLARHFTVSPDGKTLMVSLQDFDSHVTSDGGASWHENVNLYEDGFNALQPGKPTTCYAYDEASGLQVSTDDCMNYANPSRQAASLYPSRLMTQPIAFDPSDPKTMYLLSGSIVGAGLPAAPKAAFVTNDGGASFTRLAWPVSQPGMLVIDPRNAQHMIVGDLRDATRSSMLVTFDGGKRWTKSSGVPVTAFWYSATISPANGNDVLATSVDTANNVFVLRSTDGGRSFRRVATVTNAPLLRGRVGAFDRHGPDNRAEQRTGSGPPAFVYSPAREIRFNQDVTHGTPDAVVTTLRGMYLSTDLGETWHRLDDGLIAHSFWGIHWRDGYLYVGSDGQGVLRSSAVVQRP